MQCVTKNQILAVADALRVSVTDFDEKSTVFSDSDSQDIDT